SAVPGLNFEIGVTRQAQHFESQGLSISDLRRAIDNPSACLGKAAPAVPLFDATEECDAQSRTALFRKFFRCNSIVPNSLFGSKIVISIEGARGVKPQTIANCRLLRQRNSHIQSKSRRARDTHSLSCSLLPKIWRRTQRGGRIMGVASDGVTEEI